MLKRVLWMLAAIAVVGVAIYESVLRGWSVGAVVIVFALLPDVALIGAFDPVRRGALRPERVRFYNIVHLARLPIALIALGSLVQLPRVVGVSPSALVYAAGVAWLAHIAVDRALGFGLRDAEGEIRSFAGSPAPGVCQS